ncbi:MAG TPA: hypothetical protein VHL34_15630 [Rhizomicrobium sp.]|jgi:hypothetical protein|nr:hypothetical protein [Rhizomicrobium sp.]
MRTPVNVGDEVRVVKVPTSGLPPESLEIFALCVGKTFPIEAIGEAGRVELLVGNVVGVEAFWHSIWLEPGEFEPVAG